MYDDSINVLKREWTGRRVRVESDLPALQRFAGRTGTVVTVNMNGRALLRFQETLDTGWFDLPINSLVMLTESDEPKESVDAAPASQVAREDSSSAAKASPKPDQAKQAAKGRSKTSSILEMARKQGAAANHP